MIPDAGILIESWTVGKPGARDFRIPQDESTMAIKIPRDVVYRDLSGEAVILNLKTGTYFGLNEVGTRIWHLLEKQAAEDKIIEALVSEYAVDEDQARQDLTALISRLTDKGLLLTEAS